MKWWVSCKTFTVKVETRDNVIVGGAPIVRRFIGQPFDNLKSWGLALGDLKVRVLK